jgi:hypothetical protein
LSAFSTLAFVVVVREEISVSRSTFIIISASLTSCLLGYTRGGAVLTVTSAVTNIVGKSSSAWSSTSAVSNVFSACVVEGLRWAEKALG